MIKQLLSLSLFGLLSLSLYSQDEDLLNASTIPSELKVQANAVVRFEHIQIDIKAQDEMSIAVTRIVTVFNESGNKAVSAIVGYDKFRKIKRIEGIIYDESGIEVKKIRKKDFIDHSAVDGSMLYSDSRLLYMPFTPTNYPYTVKFTYEIETPNTLAIYSWKPINDYFLGIQESNYTVVDHAHLGLRFKEKHFENFNIERNNQDSELNFSIKNVQALKPEDLSPDFENFAPKLMVAVDKFQYYGVNGQAKDWEEFGDWMQKELLDGRDEITQETKEKVIEMTFGVENPIERAKRVYEFVQNNTRYISVQIGIGGNQPIPALKVDQLKYGDCKGLTNYTKALLNVANVESFYTVVEAGNEIIDLEDDFASLEQGNHIILGIPHKENIVWLDCTSQIHPFGFIGSFTDNRKVLVVKQEGSEILKTTAYLDSVNYQKTEVNAAIDVNGTLLSEVDIKTKGIQYNNRFPIEFESNDNVLKFYNNNWRYLNNLNIISKSFSNNKEGVEFEEKLNLRVKDYASINGDRLIFVPNAFNRNTFLPDRYRDRKLPLFIQRGFLDEDVTTFLIPEGYQIEALPEKFELNNKFGEYHIENTVESNKIIFKRKLWIKKGKYPKEEYNAYREFRKDIAKHDASIIVLKQTI